MLAVPLVLLAALATSAAAETGSRIVAPPGPQLASGLVATSDGGLLLTGSRDPQGVDEPWIAKLDAAGALEWALTFPGLGYSRDPVVAELAGGEFLLASPTASLGPHESDWWIARLAASGRVRSQLVLEVDAAPSDEPRLAATPDGGFFVAGSVISIPRGTDVLVARFEADDSLAWASVYAQGVAPARSRGIVSLPDGGAVVAGELDRDGNGVGDEAWFFRTEPAGRPAWSRSLGGDGVRSVSSLATTRDGGVVFAGRTWSLDGGGQSWAGKLDAAGAVAWSRHLGGAEDEGFFDVVEDESGHVLAAGYSSSFATPRLPAWLTVFDALGRLVSAQWMSSADGAVHAVAARPGGGFLLAHPTTTGPGELDVMLHQTSSIGLLRSACTEATPVELTASEPSHEPADVSVVPIAATVPVTPTWVPAASDDATVTCVLSACDPPLLCGLDVTPRIGCAGRAQTLTACVAGGVAPLVVEWDLDADGLPDELGESVELFLPAGLNEVTSTLTDSCPDGPASVSRTIEVLVDEPPEVTEVSNVRAGDPPLEVLSGGKIRIAEPAPGVRAFNVHADALGSWYAPDPARGGRCTIETWQPGFGTVVLDHDVPPGTWLVVTASSACEEGPAGTDSRGADRTAGGRWPACGPLP